jgi:hypothetical protein
LSLLSPRSKFLFVYKWYKITGKITVWTLFKEWKFHPTSTRQHREGSFIKSSLYQRGAINIMLVWMVFKCTTFKVE